jgi:glutamine synthetase
VRVERYIKDMLIELHTLSEMAHTQILPAALGYLGDLTRSAAQAKAAGISVVPQVATATEVGKLTVNLQRALGTLQKVVNNAESMHEDPAAAASLLTADGAKAMEAVRTACDALELRVDDNRWPLPRYREILFPV